VFEVYKKEYYDTKKVFTLKYTMGKKKLKNAVISKLLIEFRV